MTQLYWGRTGPSKFMLKINQPSFSAQAPLFLSHQVEFSLNQYVALVEIFPLAFSAINHQNSYIIEYHISYLKLHFLVIRNFYIYKHIFFRDFLLSLAPRVHTKKISFSNFSINHKITIIFVHIPVIEIKHMRKHIHIIVVRVVIAPF